MTPGSPTEHRASAWADPRTWAVLFAVLTVVARVLFDPAGSLLGHVLSEAPGHLWMQWLLDRALWGGADWWGQDDIIVGETLWVVPLDWINRIPGFLLGPVLGRILVYNLTFIALFTLMAVGVLRVCRRLAIGPFASALAVFLLLWAPGVLGFAADGRIDSLGMGWMALFLAAWLDAMARPTWQAGTRMGIWAMAVVLSGPNPTFVLAILAAGPSAVALYQNPQRWRPFAATGAMTAAAVCAVVGTLFYIESHDPARLVQDSGAQLRPFIERLDFSTVIERNLYAHWAGAQALNQSVPEGNIWQLPAVLHDSPTVQRATEQLVLQPFAPGAWWGITVVPWGLALVGLIRRPRAVAPWLGLALLSLFLGLGYGASQTPPLVIGEAVFYIAPASVIEQIPGFSVFNNYGLFSSTAALFIALAVAEGLQGIRWPYAVTGLAAVAWFVEVQRGPVPLPLAVADTTTPPGLIEAIQAHEAPGGLVMYPLSKDLNNYLQTLHGRPTPMRFRLQERREEEPPGDTPGAERVQSPEWNPVIADPTGALGGIANAVRGIQRTRQHFGSRLSSSGVSLVLLLPELLPPDRRPTVRQRMDNSLGKPIWSDGYSALYATQP